MKKKTSKQYGIPTTIFFLVLGGVFISVGIGVIIAVISSVVKANDFAGGAALIPLFLFGLLPLAAGTFAAVSGGKRIYLRVKSRWAEQSGADGTAIIVGSKSVRYRANVNCRYYSLTLKYKDGDEYKTFTTDYIFDRNEFRHLKSLKSIRIKTDGGFVVVAEDFAEDIYKIHPVYGVETKFFKQKPVAKILSVWRVLCIIAIVLLFISIILTTVLKDGIYLIVGASVLVGVNLPVAIILAVYLIKWIKWIKR